MAGHPLRPATRRRLGRPSPHQQADRPRAHPTPQIAFHHTTCMAWSYPVLDPVSQAYPRVQGRSPTCYSPVRHSSHSEERFPFDLHVLSTPPAFVLSQDQTLQTKTIQRKPDKTNNDKKPHPTTGTADAAKTNNKQKPPNTLLSSQTTHPFNRQPCYYTPGQDSGQTCPDLSRCYAFTRSISA